MRKYLALLVLTLVAPVTQAEDVYVNNLAGDDHNDGGAIANEAPGRGPCRTIAMALRRAQAGDRVVLAKTDQPYRESITLQGGRNSGLERTAFVLDGNGATLDGSVPVPTDQWKHVEGDIFSFRPFYLHHQQLFLGELPAARRRIDREKGDLKELKPNEWCIYRQAIHFRTDGVKAPQQLPLRLAVQPVGITLYEVHNVAVVNLTVQGFRIDGVNAHDDVRGAVLSGLTCRGNGRSGISIGGSSRVEVAGCLVGNNGEVQLRTEGRAIAAVNRSDLVVGEVSTIFDGSGRLTIDGKLYQPAEKPAPDAPAAKATVREKPDIIRAGVSMPQPPRHPDEE
ncbi:MAG: right-handed parallel beta-helix repeat-containing protein [Pirellulales bacterium]